MAEFVDRIIPPYNVSFMAQEAAIEDLQDQFYIEQVVKKTKQGLEYLQLKLSSLWLEYFPFKANFLAVKIAKNLSKINKCLLNSNIRVFTLDA